MTAHNPEQMGRKWVVTITQIRRRVVKQVTEDAQAEPPPRIIDVVAEKTGGDEQAEPEPGPPGAPRK